MDFDFSLKSLVRTQRGTIIPNWFKNPTTFPKIPQQIQQHFSFSDIQLQILAVFKNNDARIIFNHFLFNENVFPGTNEYIGIPSLLRNNGKISFEIILLNMFS